MGKVGSRHIGTGNPQHAPLQVNHFIPNQKKTVDSSPKCKKGGKGKPAFHPKHHRFKPTTSSATLAPCRLVAIKLVIISPWQCTGPSLKAVLKQIDAIPPYPRHCSPASQELTRRKKPPPLKHPTRTVRDSPKIPGKPNALTGSARLTRKRPETQGISWQWRLSESNSPSSARYKHTWTTQIH
jgi:hypothetical protein